MLHLAGFAVTTSVARRRVVNTIGTFSRILAFYTRKVLVLSQPYDDSLKKLFRANTQDFLTFVRPDLQVEAHLPAELDTTYVRADGLIRCRSAQGRTVLAHVEFQSTPDERMGERLLEYSVLASRQNEYLPVLSFVFYLRGAGTAPRPPLVLTGVDEDDVILSYYYVAIFLKELSAEDLLARNLTGLVPLLPLVKGGNTLKVVDIMAEELVKKGQADLLWIGLSLAAMMLTDQDDLHWLRRRKAMLDEFLAESPLYRETVAEAEARGRETERLEHAAVLRQRFADELPGLVRARFPALEELARRCVRNAKNDAEALLRLSMLVGSATTEQEARRVLSAGLPTR